MMYVISLFSFLFFRIDNVLSQVSTFATPGTYTFVVPAGVTNVTVKCWGAGGGGGHSDGGNGSSSSAGGGGGGGGFRTGMYTVIEGQTISIVVGLGGTGGNNDDIPGVAGGLSSTTFASATITANGGSGGAAGVDGSNGGVGGAGGSGTGGTGGFTGGTGATGGGGQNNSDEGGKGGGGAGDANPGVAGSGQSGGGTGGAVGGGSGGNGGNNSSDGVDGSTFGGGGGGTGDNADGSDLGGNGANGQVVLSWICSTPSLTNLNTTLAPASICPNSSTTITLSSTSVTSSGGPYVVYYNLTGGNTATGLFATVTFNSGNPRIATFIIPAASLINTGSTTVTITSIDCASPASGQDNTATVTVENVIPGVITKGATNQGPGCGSLDPGSTVNTNSGTGSSYRWEQSPDEINWTPATGTNTGNTYNPPVLTTTTSYRRVRITGNCEVASNILQYIVNPSPTVLPVTGGANSVCVGANTIPFTNSTPGGIWTSSNTGIATINSGTGVAHGVAVGNANIIYTLTDVNGCTGSSFAALSVVTLPAQPSVITGGAGICANATAIPYSVTNVAGNTYNWTITGTGWSIASGQGTNSITLNAGATFPQTLTVTPTNTCGIGITPRTLIIDGVITFCTSCTTCTVTADDNPDLTGACEDLKVVLVLDESASIGGNAAQVETGVMTFVSSLSCTGVELAVVEFNSGARYVLNGYVAVDNNIVTAMQNYFDNVNNALLVSNADYSPANFTNYQSALLAVDALSAPANLVLFFTDGVPTEVYLTNPPPVFGTTGTQCGGTGAPQAAEIGNPALIANKLKCEGTHMFVLGVGGIGATEIPTIAMLSGSTAHSMANTIANSDYALEDFDALAMCLSMFVSELCPFQTDASSQDVCPNGTNGSISITVPNEFLPYDYAYFLGNNVVPLGSGSNINTSPLVINGLAAGMYRVEIYVDLPGNCTRTETFFLTIVAGAVNVIASVTGTVEPTCLNPDGGTATLTITAGESPYMITLKKSGMTEPGYPVMGYFNTVYTATGLDAGSYTFELKDANLCNTDIDAFTINPPANCCSPICPPNVQIQCGSSTFPAQTGTPTNVTGCGIITFSDISVSGICPVVQVITRTWISSTNGTICTQTITVIDTSPPMINVCAVSRTVEGCGTSAILEPPFSATTVVSSESIFESTPNNGNVTDNCGISSVTYRDIAMGGCPIVVTRTWTINDGCGNSSTCNQTINVEDNAPPQIYCPGDLTLNCDAGTNYVALINAWLATASASDACDANVPVTHNYDGVSIPDFSCQEGLVITFSATDDCGNTGTCIATIHKPCFTMESWVYLEGAAANPSGGSSYALPMRTTLNDLRVLPGQILVDAFFGNKYSPPGQPYNIAPWSYLGNEGSLYDSGGNPLNASAGYPSTVVDWVLVSLRSDSAGTGGPVCQTAALLHKDGVIQFVKPLTCCGVNENAQYYVVIEHRNHLIVMSHGKVSFINHKISYDFRFQQSWEDPLFAGLNLYAREKEIMTGKFAMYTGNGKQSPSLNADTDTNFDDRSFWESQNGAVGFYRIGDYNLNGDTNFNDRIAWERNNGKFTSVPRN